MKLLFFVNRFDFKVSLHFWPQNFWKTLQIIKRSIKEWWHACRNPPAPLGSNLPTWPQCWEDWGLLGHFGSFLVPFISQEFSERCWVQKPLIAFKARKLQKEHSHLLEGQRATLAVPLQLLTAPSTVSMDWSCPNKEHLDNRSHHTGRVNKQPAQAGNLIYFPDSVQSKTRVLA